MPETETVLIDTTDDQFTMRLDRNDEVLVVVAPGVRIGDIVSLLRAVANDMEARPTPESNPATVRDLPI